MKIFNHSNLTKAMKVYNQKGTEAVKNKEKLYQSKDELQLSASAKDFQIAMKAFKNLPEVREEKVSKLKEQVSQRKYNPTGQEIADKILEGIMIDRKI